MRLTFNWFAFLLIVPLILMVLSAHNGDLTWTIAMGFTALFMMLFSMLHDIHITLWVLLRIFDETTKEEEYEED